MWELIIDLFSHTENVNLQCRFFQDFFGGASREELSTYVNTMATVRWICGCGVNARPADSNGAKKWACAKNVSVAQCACAELVFSVFHFYSFFIILQLIENHVESYEKSSRENLPYGVKPHPPHTIDIRAGILETIPTSVSNIQSHIVLENVISNPVPCHRLQEFRVASCRNFRHGSLLLSNANISSFQA